MRRVLAVDMHAHVATSLDARDTEELGTLVQAATRSLDELEEALAQTDDWVVWGSAATRVWSGSKRHSTSRASRSSSNARPSSARWDSTAKPVRQWNSSDVIFGPFCDPGKGAAREEHPQLRGHA